MKKDTIILYVQAGFTRSSVSAGSGHCQCWKRYACTPSESLSVLVDSIPGNAYTSSTEKFNEMRDRVNTSAG